MKTIIYQTQYDHKTNIAFIETKEFTTSWLSLDLNDHDLYRLEVDLANNPEQGDVMPGTGGFRKMRFAFENCSKSNLSKAERNSIK